MDRKEIIIDGSTKGIIAYAKPRLYNLPDWIVLVSNTTRCTDIFGRHYYVVYTYSSSPLLLGDSVNPSGNVTKSPWPFCTTDSFKFYEVTEDERKHILELIKSKKLKYVKSLNRLIDR